MVLMSSVFVFCLLVYMYKENDNIINQGDIINTPYDIITQKDAWNGSLKYYDFLYMKWSVWQSI